MTIYHKYLYDISEGDITPQGHLEIPDGVTGIATSCMPYSYPYNERLTSVTFPDSCTFISNWAFARCNCLETVKFGNGLKIIGYRAFEGCAKLKEVIFNDGLETIDRNAFAYCYSLKSAMLPDSVKIIDQCSFYNCSSLAKIHVPANLQYIGDAVFMGCNFLRSEEKNYKAFGLDADGRLACHGLHYTVGKRTAVKGALEICRHGIHYCTNLFEIFNYYHGRYGADFVIGECKVSKEYEEVIGNSKKCARAITPIRIYKWEELIDPLNKE